MATDTKPEDPSDEAHVTDEHVLVSVLGDHPKTKILATFIGNPEMDFNVTEIAEYSNLKRDTVYKYLDTLKGWGLIEETRRVGNSQMYALNTENDANEAFAKFEWELLTHLGDKEQADELDDQNNPLP